MGFDTFCNYLPISLVVRVFTKSLGDWDFNPRLSYQRLKKWYLITPCLTLSIIRYWSRIKWSNPGKGVENFSILWCSGYWKGSLQVVLNNGRQLYLLTFLKVISPKVNVIVWLEFELTYFEADVQYFRHYATMTFKKTWLKNIWNCSYDHYLRFESNDLKIFLYVWSKILLRIDNN